MKKPQPKYRNGRDANVGDVVLLLWQGEPAWVGLLEEKSPGVLFVVNANIAYRVHNLEDCVLAADAALLLECAWPREFSAVDPVEPVPINLN